MTLSTSHKQCWLLEPLLIRVERKRAHVIQRILQDAHRYPPSQLVAPMSARQVRQQELSYTDILLLAIIAQDLVGFRLLRELGIFNLAHCLDVFRKAAGKGGFHGRIIHDNNPRDERRMLQCYCHGGFGTHAMADEDGTLQVVGLDEVCDVGRHGDIVVPLYVWAITMVTQIESIHRSIQILCKCPGGGGSDICPAGKETEAGFVVLTDAAVVLL